ncbi:MAG: Asd/ArgC dimerization domain-containing protein [Myxococcota bacterium]
MSHRIAIVGATGYVGQVAHALLMQHPRVDVAVVETRIPDAALPSCAGADVVLLATPSDAARRWADVLRGASVRVLDLSDAHRQQDGIHYGVPELFGTPPPDADLVANPGCYPTASLLALRPLLEAECIEPDGIAIMGASGTSGAGKALRDDLHFSALAGNLFPYKVGAHRHTPEIERHLGAPVSFVPTLLPIVRGMLVTAFVRPRRGPDAVLDALRARYEPHPWITVLPKPGMALGVRHVVGTHQAVLAVGPEARSGVVPVFAAIDNLLRGAASQAVHNLNLWLGLPAELGLPPPRPDIVDGPPPMTRMLP